MLNDPLANALSKIINAEKIGLRSCLIKPASQAIKKVLSIMNEQGFVGQFKVVEDGKGGFLEIALLGEINKCGVIKPQFSTKYTELIKWERRFLPAKDFGVIILSTPKGYMIHTEARKQKIGGKLIAYCY